MEMLGHLDKSVADKVHVYVAVPGLDPVAGDGFFEVRYARLPETVLFVFVAEGPSPAWRAFAWNGALHAGTF